jgi:two-component system CheB/CheR fusion protein
MANDDTSNGKNAEDDPRKNARDGPRKAGKPFIVAIGASAGGIQALQAFIGSLPPTTGAAYVVVVHLDPQRRSELPSILAARTRMPVVQIEGKQKLAADHVYVIPPDRRLQMIDHEVSAVEFEQPRGHRSPIDQFFRSVAERIGDGFAVVLSGAGSDGAIGVRAIKEAGGIILVQDPEEAEWASMPRSVIATGVADFVLPAQALAQHLADLLRSKQSSPLPDVENFDEDLLRRILAHLRVRTGHDFSKYKQSTVVRRIARRMQVTRTDELNDYYDFLRENADEPQSLLRDLLISVTTFFRDTGAFDTLVKSVLPNLFKDKDPSEPVRVWVCGCATGEEAYTLAMLLLEEAGGHELRLPIQIFASDLDARALALAREGRYPAAIETDVNEERLRRFFTPEGDHYRLRQEVRDLVLFAVHDLLKDPPFSHVDLISCRNVLIYLDRELQEQVCNTFHYALNPAGFLFVGSSEMADYPVGLFRLVDRSARLYQSTAQVGEKPRRLVPHLLGPVRAREPLVQYTRGLSPTVALGDAAMHRRAIEQVAPPSILVDEAHRVIHLSDHAGRYLMPSGGPLSGDIGDLARPELRFELRSSLNRAFERNISTLSLPIPVRFNGAPHRVLLLVKPSKHEGVPRRALVMFVEGEAVDPNVLSSDQQDETVRRLTQELELTQSRLRTLGEESDAANEELRAANEELQSINEEYRSTSEELETSKEELQSINEELQTVNTELKLKLDAISRAHSDLQNLMAATDFGTLFLDASLRIKRFTRPVTDLFSVTPSDEGRPITDFAHQLDYPDLIQNVRTVLADLAPIHREVRSRADRWYDVRLRPYRTVEDKIDGVVITFVDISDRRQTEQALRTSEQLLLNEKQLINLSREPILVWDLEDGILQWNRGCEEFYGFKRTEAIGQQSQRLLGTTVPGSSFEQVKSTLRERGSWRGELIQRTKDGRELTLDSRLELVAVEGHRLVFESARDITEHKQWEQHQKLLLRELNHRVKNTLAVVQAIAHQTMRSATTNKDFVKSFEGRVAALASAHDLLVESDWRGADLASLAREQLKPYISDDPTRAQIEGPPVLLPPGLASPFGFLIYELATNAAKYGALSVPTGKISLNWSVVADGNPTPLLKFVWGESGGPRVKPPTTRGFGSVLIEQGIPQARVQREFKPKGVVCAVEVPLLSKPDT